MSDAKLDRYCPCGECGLDRSKWACEGPAVEARCKLEDIYCGGLDAVDKATEIGRHYPENALGGRVADACHAEATLLWKRADALTASEAHPAELAALLCRLATVRTLLDAISFLGLLGRKS